MRLKLPRINVKHLRSGVVLIQARDPVKQHLWPVLDVIGEKRIRRLIEIDRPFHTHIPEEWKQALESAGGYRWAIAALTDDDLISLLPPWLVELIKADEKSQLWIGKEIEWLRAQFNTGGKRV